MDSFWATPNNVNWNTEEYGREGIGIPKTIIKNALKSNQKLLILVERTGCTYEASPRKIAEHDEKWNTAKTAPKGTKNIFVIVPVAIMEFQGFTAEKTALMEQQKKEAEAAAKIAEAQTSLF